MTAKEVQAIYDALGEHQAKLAAAGFSHAADALNNARTFIVAKVTRDTEAAKAAAAKQAQEA